MTLPFHPIPTPAGLIQDYDTTPKYAYPFDSDMILYKSPIVYKYKGMNEMIKDRQMNEWTDEGMDGWMDIWMDGWMDG